MPTQVVTVPCRADNYAFLVHNDDTGQTALIDAPEAAPIRAALDQRGWTLTDILITHHHDDHVEAVAALRGQGGRVIGAAADAHRLPALDLAVEAGGSFETAGHQAQVIDVSGHTIGHIAFYMPEIGHAFTADSLMALGCGRLFEGDGAMMWASMQRLAALPPETIICSGHEYTAANGAFALTIEPGNADLIARVKDVREKRAQNIPTVPSTLAAELATNPFLRPDAPEIRENLAMTGASDAEVFTEIRARKDAF
ncbi:hydroxyacylglutathione hydrolase [Alphaproteobacteria bacterium KMM 3653]|uniref:Hydroxyacylglutathione hydrolase n=1 Tax=Harenicola maris TaxID=2841044 RepID=A0AAP2CR47_9RHOB|nr:hydroxyacylglutathione hydrolase [Harenicola maris]